jgi:hypothetical protein
METTSVRLPIYLDYSSSLELHKDVRKQTDWFWFQTLCSHCFFSIKYKLDTKRIALKGQCHYWYFFKAETFYSALSVYALMVWRSFKSFSLLYTIINFLFGSLKLLTNFENAYWNRLPNSILCDWSMFSSADLSLAAGKMRMHKEYL